MQKYVLTRTRWRARGASLAINCGLPQASPFKIANREEGACTYSLRRVMQRRMDNMKFNTTVIAAIFVSAFASTASAQYAYNGRLYQGPVRQPNIMPRTYNSTAPYVQMPQYQYRPRLPSGSIALAGRLRNPGGAVLGSTALGAAIGGGTAGATWLPRSVGNECGRRPLPGARC
jgi:hypothetical protein